MLGVDKRFFLWYDAFMVERNENIVVYGWMSMETNYRIYRSGNLIGYLPLSVISKIYGKKIIMICNPRENEPFVVVG